MKKVLTLVFSSLLIVLLLLPAAADMGYMPADIEYAIVGLNGFWYSPLGSSELEYLPLEFGTLIHVLGDMGGGMYYVEFPYPAGETSFGTITEGELGNLLPVDELVGPEFGQRLQEKTAKVKPWGGIEMKYGPHENFDSVLTIPWDAKIVYEYTFNGWGFTEYDGEFGWVRLTSVETVRESEESETVPEDVETRPEATSEMPETTAPVETAPPKNTQPAAPESKPAQTEPAEESSDSSTVLTVVIVCVIVADVIGVAVIIIIIIKIKIAV